MVKKKYDAPKTPYKRGIAAGAAGDEARTEFHAALTERGPLHDAAGLRPLVQRCARRLRDQAALTAAATDNI